MSGFFSFANKTIRQKQFRQPKRYRGDSGSLSGSITAYASDTSYATLGAGNLRQQVKLPAGEDENEWIAVNLIDFFQQVSMLYGTIIDFCTNEACPSMSAGPKYEYLWADSKMKKPIKCSASTYIDYLITWVQEQLDDETLFPSVIGIPFPKNFKQQTKIIMKRLFRIYAHVYHSHFAQIAQVQAEPHLNTSFKHFIYFSLEFKLIEQKDLAPLKDLLTRLMKQDDLKYGSAASSSAATESTNAK